MAAPRPALTLFSPMPPARNGIADYAAMLRDALAPHYAVGLGDEAAAPAARVLHQMGNNPDHAFVLRALRRWPGVVTLHDPSLLWLRQLLGEPFDPPLGDGPLARLAAQRAQALAGGEGPGRSDHLLLDQAGEILARSRAVVVHSHFAAARLRALHGDAAAARVAVIPMLLASPAPVARAEARRRLGLPQQGLVLGSAGFAHPSKRFDWLVEALDQAGPGLHYLHAGGESPAVPLAAMLRARPSLAGRWRLTGWLEEDALHAHIAACDALAVLHFPSHGETSGVLPRALALGTACLLADTAGYREIPRDAAFHLPVPDAVPALAALLRQLAADPARAHAVGEVGRRWAERETAPARVAALYRDVIEQSLPRAPLRAPVVQRQAPPRVLLVAPMHSHPPDQGNAARLAAFGAALKARGAAVELLYYGMEGLPPGREAAMRAAWNGFHFLAPETPRQSLPGCWGLDDWCPDRLCDAVAALHRAQPYRAVVANYVWQSRVLEHVPGALRLLDTHDLFGDRHLLARRDGIEPNWYFTTRAEEARGLARADLVLGIQAEESAELRRRGARAVMTVGHPLPRAVAPIRGALAPFGVLASGNPWNLLSVQALDRALAGAPALPWLLAGGILDNPALRLRSAPLKLGRVRQVGEFYAQVDCVLNPMQGGTGLKIKTVEALGYGLPVIGTRDAFAGMGATHPAHQAADAAGLLAPMREWQASPAFRAELRAASAALAAGYGAAVEAQYDALGETIRKG